MNIGKLFGRGRGRGRVSKYIDLSEVETGVFWNMVECPIPEGMDIGGVVANITKSLKDEGFYGRVTVHAFDNTNHFLDQSHFKAPVVFYRLRSGGDADANLMMSITEFLCWAVRHPAPPNILLIVKDITGHSGIIRAFDRLTRKQYNCMVAQQVDSSLLFDDSIDKAWLWDHLASGGPALSPPPLDDTIGSTSHSHSEGVTALEE